MGVWKIGLGLSLAVTATWLTACSGDTGSLSPVTVSSCMQCHNGTLQHNYNGPGIENPHPFPGADDLECEVCHGGNPDGFDMASSHVPPPPEVGDRDFQDQNATAYFNKLTLTGMDKFPDYTVNGQTHTALEYLKFVNPGDLRVVSTGESCGACHGGHAECVNGSLLATQTGMLGGAMFAAGVDNQVPENVGLYERTASDLAFRAVENLAFDPFTASIGQVARLIEYPVFSVRGANGPTDIHNNPDYDVAEVADDTHADGRLVTGSALANLYHEQVAFTCGDCHLGSSGANNRYGDFRSSGCTACHMPYSLSGRAGTSDPNVNKLEPLDVDDIDDPERPHVRSHQIVSVAKTMSNGHSMQGIDDHTCAGCHQGSNRTVMQFWGIRLDQNQDVRFGNQYPAQPVSWQGTHGDTRLFDPAIGNHTFNGRNANQYLLFEDYDGDGRDDTPADVHHEAGMGCIDCHGSHDMHGGDPTSPGTDLASRMEQSVSIACEDCHGSVGSYADTIAGTTYDGDAATIGVDSGGNPMRHVTRNINGHYYLKSRLDGALHYLPQTRDYVVDTGRLHPTSGDPIYSEKASFAMGRDDGSPATGIGPQQSASPHTGFAHADKMNCVSCHSSWTNTCMGCHLEGEYNTGNNFSNITGERIVFREKEADFVYQSPVFFQLGVNAHDKITQVSPNTKMWFLWEDRNNDRSERTAFSDRNSTGANPATAFPSMSHNAMMAHSVRGKVQPTDEGPRYCVACHLTDDAITAFGPEYDTFRTAIRTGDYGSLDFDLLRDHIGLNPGNQLNSPLWVHQVAGLGSGLFLFDEQGAPVNPLDDHNDRAGTDNVPPSTVFDPLRVFFDLDRIVTETGSSNGSSNHALLTPGGSSHRDGSTNPNLAGPLGASILMRLADPVNGLILNSWLDADGEIGGDAGDVIGN